MSETYGTAAESDYIEIPQPDDIPIREREDAMGAYFMMFASLAAGLPFPIINLIAAVVYHFVNKSKSRFVHFHSLQSVLSQLPTTLINAVAVIWFVRLLIKEADFPDIFLGYLAMAAVVNILYFAFSIVAAVRARRGRMFYFLFFGRISYHYAFLNKEKVERQHVNAPPKL